MTSQATSFVLSAAVLESLSPCSRPLTICLCFLRARFEFDVPLEEVQTRKLDVAVKNNKMFYTRERKDIGMVGDDSVGIHFHPMFHEGSIWRPAAAGVTSTPQ